MNADRENELVIPYAVPRPAQPFWVKLGLLGLPNRASAWAFIWICLGLAAVCVALGFRHWAWFIAAATMLFPAWWYWASIRWVDRHGGWSQVRG